MTELDRDCLMVEAMLEINRMPWQVRIALQNLLTVLNIWRQRDKLNE